MKALKTQVNNCIRFICSGTDLIAWMMKSMDIDDQGETNFDIY